MRHGFSRPTHGAPAAGDLPLSQRSKRKFAATARSPGALCCRAPSSSRVRATSITTVRDAPDDLLARLHEAEEALRARDDFLAVAAHELRSPMHALGLRVAALERIAGQEGAPRLQQELRRMRSTVDRYVRRAVTLLDLSRLHAGALRPLRERVQVQELAQAIVDDYQEEARFHGATVSAEVEPGLAGDWDAHMLEQVLANLVSNAIKYGRGTPVRLRATRMEPDSACFEVSDEGPGIDPEHRDRLFRKFERVVARDNSAGFGLGLWIVGRMVAAHHGSIVVAAGPRGGALFRVILPMEAPATGRQDESR